VNISTAPIGGGGYPKLLAGQKALADDVEISFNGGSHGESGAEPVVERGLAGSKNAHIRRPQLKPGELSSRKVSRRFFCNVAATKQELARPLGGFGDGSLQK